MSLMVCLDASYEVAQLTVRFEQFCEQISHEKLAPASTALAVFNPSISAVRAFKRSSKFLMIKSHVPWSLARVEITFWDCSKVNIWFSFASVRELSMSAFDDSVSVRLFKSWARLSFESVMSSTYSFCAYFS